MILKVGGREKASKVEFSHGKQLKLLVFISERNTTKFDRRTSLEPYNCRFMKIENIKKDIGSWIPNE